MSGRRTKIGQIKRDLTFVITGVFILSSPKRRTLLKRESNASIYSIVVAMLIHMYRLFIIIHYYYYYYQYALRATSGVKRMTH